MIITKLSSTVFFYFDKNALTWLNDILILNIINVVKGHHYPLVITEFKKIILLTIIYNMANSDIVFLNNL